MKNGIRRLGVAIAAFLFAVAVILLVAVTGKSATGNSFVPPANPSYLNLVQVSVVYDSSAIGKCRPFTVYVKNLRDSAGNVPGQLRLTGIHLCRSQTFREWVGSEYTLDQATVWNGEFWLADSFAGSKLRRFTFDGIVPRTCPRVPPMNIQFWYEETDATQYVAPCMR